MHLIFSVGLKCARPHKKPDLITQSAQINRVVHGSISAEHGLSQLKRENIGEYKSALELKMMGNIQRALDPQDLMNPGSVL
ncbi:MAG: FAD-linked oxidase C-terminal domain-containing protein [Gallionellaceae bacterium]|nr:FAD-linked oxidase C-terminal domain-containing protein [Gallionellaceae bacterium]